MLATFFALGSLVCHVRWGKTGKRGAYIASICLFIPALLAKPTVVTLPLLMLVLDYWPLKRRGRKILIEKIPFLALACISAIVTFVSQSNTSVAEMPGSRPPLEVLYVVCHNVVFYLEKMIWPAALSAHYPYPQPMDLSQPSVFAGIIGTILLIIVLLWSLRRTRAAAAGFLFFFIALAPTLGIIGFTDTIAAIRFLYLPSVGLILLVAGALAYFWSDARPRAGVRAGVIAGVLLIASAQIGLTRMQLRHWRDTSLLYSHMLSIAPDAPTINYNAAIILFGQNRHKEAIPYFQKVLDIRPDFAAAHADLGSALFQTGRFAEGEAHLKKAIELQPELAEAKMNLGTLYRDQGRINKAIETYRDAIGTKPTLAQAYVVLADMLIAYSRTDEAVETLREGLTHQPGSSDLHLALGLALHAKGDLQGAIVEIEKAMNAPAPNPSAAAALRAIKSELRR